MGTSARIPILATTCEKTTTQGYMPNEESTRTTLPQNIRAYSAQKFFKMMDKFRDFARPPQVENLLNAEAGLLTYPLPMPSQPI